MMERAELGQKLYSRMRLWEFPDQYVIEPTDGSTGSPLSINRMDGSMALIGSLYINSFNQPPISPSSLSFSPDHVPVCDSLRVPKIQIVYGVVGMLKLVTGSYLILITDRLSVGSYMGHPIFKATSMKVFPCDQSLRNSSPEQKKMEIELSALLGVVLKTPGLYFSYDANLTLSVQKLHDLGDESKLLPLWRQAEPRFLWNSYMLEALIENKLDPFLLPIIQGSFQSFQAAIGKDIIEVILIARRCTRRNGTRMWRRGADPDGYVANFVETEQIVHMNGFTLSFVQIRGSIPLLWEQIVDLTYKPKFEIIQPEEAGRVADRHFLDLRKKYGSVFAVDLVNKHGGEGRLCERYGAAMQNITNEEVRYWHFDFHKICGHAHFERLSILYDQIEPFLQKHGYLLLNEKGEKLKEQSGIVRSNCIDCLDRTNVTQSLIARKILEIQLRRIGVFGAEETINCHSNLDDYFKILWANHGDEISIQYSGTPALKGDFVRYGHRTVQGIVNDGWNALARYYFNNFSDGKKQDAIDLLHGHYIVSVSRDGTSSQTGGFEAFASLPVALLIMMTGVVLALSSLRQAHYDHRHWFFSMVWGGVSFGVASVVRTYGRIFCNRPRLHRPRSSR